MTKNVKNDKESVRKQQRMSKITQIYRKDNKRQRIVKEIIKITDKTEGIPENNTEYKWIIEII